MKKAILLTTTLLLSIAGFAQSGTTGTLTWSIENGTLTISGTGAMPDYDNSPWFDYRSSFTSLNIQEGVTSIGSAAFIQCYQLESIIIPNSVTRIEDYAFYECMSLKSIVIPSSVRSIGYSAFGYCYSLKSITALNPVPTTVSSNVFDYVNKTACTLTVPTVAVSAYSTANEWKDFNPIVAGGYLVKASANSAFLGTVSGNELPLYALNTVVSLNAVANDGCSFLNWTTAKGEVVSATAAYSFAVTQDTVLTANFERAATTHLDVAGTLASRLTDPETVSRLTVSGSIDARDIKFMRDNMPSLINLDISTASIAAYLGTEGTHPSETVYPANEIPNYAFHNPAIFAGKLSLKSVVFPENLTGIRDYAFYNCTGLTGELTIPQGVTTIGNSAFSGCRGLTGELTLPNSVRYIGDNAFSYCEGLTGELTLPNLVINIGNSAFSGCTGFTGKLIIPQGVASIGNGAFFVCRGFTGELTIPNSVTTIGNNAFYGCDNLTSINVAEDNTNYSSIDGVLCNKEKTTLIKCPEGKAGTFTVPHSVTNIIENAFSSCRSLTSVNVVTDNTAYSSTDGILYNKEKTTLIKCPAGKAGDFFILNSVIRIEDFAFAGCTNLTGALIIPAGVTRIGSFTFNGCSGLTSVIIPGSVTDIWDYAFAFCYGLNKIRVRCTTPPVVHSLAFVDVNKATCVLEVPAGTTAAYRQAAYWNEFINITEFEPEEEIFTLQIKSSEAGYVSQYVKYGTSLSFGIAASEGWAVNTVMYNDTDITEQSVDGVYTLPAVTANSVLSVSFIRDVPSGVIGKRSETLKVYTLNNDIVVSGIAAGESITVYNISGVLLRNTSAQADKTVIGGLPKNAVYIVKAAGETVKVVL